MMSFVARIVLSFLVVWVGYTSCNAQTQVSVDFRTQRFIGNSSSLDRTKYINLHGDFSTNYNAAELSYMVNDLGINFGRNLGNIRWIMAQHTADANNPDLPDPAGMQSQGQNSINSFKNNATIKPYNTDQIVYTSHITPLYPNPVTAGNPPNGFVPQTNAGAASFLRQFFDTYFAADPSQDGKLRPKYYEGMNEPFVHRFELNTNVTEMSAFFKVVADTLHAAFPEMKVGGPVSAWPEYERNDFGQWNTTMKTFIDVAGAKMDFISMHFYDTPGDFTEIGSLRAGSNVEAILDLVESYTNQKFGSPTPLMVSEYGACCGGQGWDGPYSEYRDWRILKATNALLMTFLKRQNRIEKTIPFIVGKATWWLNSHADPYPHVIYHPDGNAWKTTHLVKWYEFWQGVAGERVAISTTDPDIQLEAFVNGQKGYVFLNNFEFNDHDINLQLDQLSTADVSEVRLRRLYLDPATQAPVLQLDTLSASPNQLTLKAEESVMIEYVFANTIAQQDSLWEDRFFAQEYLRPIKAGQAVEFSFQNVSTTSVGTASLRLGIGRAHGLSLQPQLSINGTSIPVPTDWMGYDQATRQNFFGMIEVPFDVSLLTSQTSIQITFPDQGGHIASAVIQLSSPNITITDLEEETQSASLEVYPNPASHRLEIMLPEELRDSFRLELIDHKGSQVWAARYQYELGTSRLSLDLQDQTPGVYVLRLQSGNLLLNEKIIIQ